MILPPTLPAYERAARVILPPDVAAYLFGGAGAEATLAANRAAFDRVGLVPKAFGRIAARPITLFGQRYEAPILVAPMGRQALFHPRGEPASARAAAALGLGYVAAMLSSAPLSEIRTAAEGAAQWFQLYLRPDRSGSASLLREAEAAGFRAIVVTADAPIDGVRDRQIEAGFRLPALAGQSAPSIFAPDWDDLAWLRRQTSLPLVVKGVMSADDALRAIGTGADAVVVSNHGGRILDGAMGALNALRDVARAVGDKAPVLFDSGIRRGSDIAKALRLGARAVLVGRPVACGLAVAGDRGAAHVLRMLTEEFLIADGLSGPELALTSSG